MEARRLSKKKSLEKNKDKVNQQKMESYYRRQDTIQANPELVEEQRKRWKEAKRAQQTPEVRERRRRKDALKRRDPAVREAQRMKEAERRTRHPDYNASAREYQKHRREQMQNEKDLFKSFEAAKMCGVTPKTLRHWEDKGFIQPAMTTPGGQRMYRKDDLDRLLIETARRKEERFALPENFDIIRTYGELTEYTLAFAEGLIPFLLLIGSPGSGKSRQIKSDLSPFRHVWIDNHVTPLGLYVAAYEANNVPIVMDDVNHFISTKQTCSLMKALTQTENKKAVSWENPNAKVLIARDIPTRFATESPLCLIGNRWDVRNEDYAAIQDRALPVGFFPNAETIHKRVIELGWCDDDIVTVFV
jgi:DNA-binding transcriptional MerR regulator